MSKLKKMTVPFDVYIQTYPYAVETLINGNVTECITYLKGLIEYGLIGIGAMHDELITIKEQYPERYAHIRAKVFSL